MKRLGSTDSLGGLTSICPTTDHHSPRTSGHVYTMEFQSMLDGLDEEGCVEESGHVAEKKRRLSVDQVKALEKNFEVENKLEPERKVKLAQELGLQPRQVAVWFQNRRARWKTKQLERDYGVLKANFDSLKHNYDYLQRDHEALRKEIRELKSKVGESGKAESNDLSVKEEMVVPESEHNEMDQQISDGKEQPSPTPTAFGSSEVNNGIAESSTVLDAASVFPDFKDGSSDSDSSAILNEEYNNRSPNTAAILMSPPSSPELKFGCSSPAPSGFQFQKMYQTQFVKLEEHNFFTGDEACNFFSDEQAPSLQQWYCHDPWPSS